MKRKRFIYCCLFIFCIQAVLLSQEMERDNGDTGKDSVKLGKVVVTATKTQVHEAETGSSVIVITGEEIRKKGKRFVVDVLKEVPGVTVSKSGNITYIYLRGAEHGNTMVLIDGMRANDPISINKSFDFGNILTDNIERIEIIKGAQSTLYGSEASAGVINIITRKGTEKNIVMVSLETGYADLPGGAKKGYPRVFNESASLTGKCGIASYALSVAQSNRGGYSSASEKGTSSGDFEDDNYSNTTFSSKLGLELPWNVVLENSLYFSYADFDMDDWVNDDDLNRAGTQRNIITSTSLKHAPFDIWDYSLTFGYNNLKRTDIDDVDSAEPLDLVADTWFRGTDIKTEWQNNIYIGKIDTITAGFEYSRERGESYSMYGAPPASEFDKNAWTLNGYIQNHLKLWKRLFVLVGMRNIYHKEFHNTVTWQGSLSYIIPVTETRIRGVYGTGFKAPTLYQLYEQSTYVIGNPDLRPEKSWSYETGVDQNFLDDKIQLSVTYFDTRYREMINSIETAPWTYEYINTGKSLIRGVETGMKLYLPYEIIMQMNYTYMKSEDVSTGEELLKRPSHKLSTGLDWTFLEDGNVNVIFNYIGKRKESSSITLDGYCTLDLAASYWIREWLQAFFRIENLTNADYVEYTGYTTPGISLYAGLKGKLEFGGEEKNEAE